MKNVNLQPFVILALNYDHAEEEIVHLRELDLNIKALRGSYKGTKERSYLVIVDTISDFKKAIKLADNANQESILYVDKEREASLIPINSEMPQQYLGNWKEYFGDVSNLDAWTQDPSTGRYYICE